MANLSALEPRHLAQKSSVSNYFDEEVPTLFHLDASLVMPSRLGAAFMDNVVLGLES